MSPSDLQVHLHTHIPLSAAIEVAVVQASDDEIVLEAPIAPNRNHRSTVFGGSISCLGILSAWTWLHHYTRKRQLSPALVIQREKMQYLAPANGSFRAHCPAPSEKVREAFLGTLKRYRRARVELHATVTSEGIIVARFSGSFVALDAPPPDFEPQAIF